MIKLCAVPESLAKRSLHPQLDATDRTVKMYVG